VCTPQGLKNHIGKSFKVFLIHDSIFFLNVSIYWEYQSWNMLKNGPTVSCLNPWTTVFTPLRQLQSATQQKQKQQRSQPLGSQPCPIHWLTCLQLQLPHSSPVELEVVVIVKELPVINQLLLLHPLLFW
jgi:hypothetical protein